ncbi:helix-turn-helix domain-containing protein [Wielerella bovis]|uniref:helix-turn-helix domain-containing protein n=1 Tax=Wielerella bovis TaxID=2917790 RepID=UPI002018F1DC|nr:helix-turn-helix domain-containing protein [Wielerella bovis]ULJ67889.1 helix-turn-helix domain-containing protein [Wielerella bovis]
MDFNVGEWVKTARKNAGLTQEDLALYLGLSGKASISAYETGKQIPPLDKIIEIANYCNTAFHYPVQYIAKGATFGDNATIQGNHNFSVTQTIVNTIKNENTHIIMPDNSMSPIIPQGSELWIDEQETKIYDNKTYWLTWQGRPAPIARCLVFNPNGLLDVIAHNKDVSNHTIQPDKIQILGRVIAWKVLD